MEKELKEVRSDCSDQVEICWGYFSVNGQKGHDSHRFGEFLERQAVPEYVDGENQMAL